MPNQLNTKIKKPLRKTLILWFLGVSILPLIGLTTFAVYRFQSAMTSELMERLKTSQKEAESYLFEFRDSLQSKINRWSENRALIYYISIEESRLAREWFERRRDVQDVDRITAYSQNGSLLHSLKYDRSENVLVDIPALRDSLGEDELSEWSEREPSNLFSQVEIDQQGQWFLVFQKKMVNHKGTFVGVLQAAVELSDKFIENFKSHLQSEFVLIHPQKRLVFSSLGRPGEMSLEPVVDYFSQRVDEYLKFSWGSEEYLFYLKKMNFLSEGEVLLATGRSERPLKEVLAGVNYSFVLIMVLLIGVISFLVVVISRSLIKPIEDLLEATQKIQEEGDTREIRVKTDSEIGLLTKSFNQMSESLSRARAGRLEKIQELEETNKNLKQTQAQLVQSAKMASLGQLVAGVAHELNNPIGFIFSNIESLKSYLRQLFKLIEENEKLGGEKFRQAQEELDYDYIKGDLPKLVAAFEEGAERTRDIVLGLKSFSRVDEAKLKHCDLHESLDSTLKLLASELKERIDVHREYGELPLVNCYVSSINQVFMNILQNAAQAIKGSGNITIRTKAVTIKGKEFVEVSIKDDGMGMPEDVRAKIFDPFFTTKEVGEGTGLGMSISFEIIRKHGGEIEVLSQIDKGTTFVISLPVEPLS